MLKQFLLMVVVIGLFASCRPSAAASNSTPAAQPRYHKGYYKKHIYRKRYHIGRLELKLFEKQGTKTVKKK